MVSPGPRLHGCSSRPIATREVGEELKEDVVKSHKKETKENIWISGSHLPIHGRQCFVGRLIARVIHKPKPSWPPGVSVSNNSCCAKKKKKKGSYISRMQAQPAKKGTCKVNKFLKTKNTIILKHIYLSYTQKVSKWHEKTSKTTQLNMNTNLNIPYSRENNLKIVNKKKHAYMS